MSLEGQKIPSLSTVAFLVEVGTRLSPNSFKGTPIFTTRLGKGIVDESGHLEVGDYYI